MAVASATEVCFTNSAGAFTEPIDMFGANAILAELDFLSITGKFPVVRCVAEQGNDLQNWTAVANSADFSGPLRTQFEVKKIAARFVRLTFVFVSGTGQGIVSYTVETKQL